MGSDPIEVYQRICAVARAGDADGAARLLREALDRGQWYGAAMLDAPALASLRGGAYEALVADSLAAARRGASAAAPTPVETPGGPGPYPCLLALHGNGGHAQESMRAWRPAVDAGWMVAAAASDQWICAGRAVWDDETSADHAVLTRYAALAGRIDAARFVAAGFSMGGETALRLALDGRLPAVGVISLATAGPRTAYPEGWLARLAAGVHHDVRVYLVVGSEDDDGRRVVKHRRLVEALTAAGVAVRLEIIPRLGHAYPPDFGQVIERALAHVTPG